MSAITDMEKQTSYFLRTLIQTNSGVFKNVPVAVGIGARHYENLNVYIQTTDEISGTEDL
jgi:hypothetical protein